MSIEVTDELIALVKEHKHYNTDSTARHLAAYICEEVLSEIAIEKLVEEEEE